MYSYIMSPLRVEFRKHHGKASPTDCKKINAILKDIPGNPNKSTRLACCVWKYNALLQIIQYFNLEHYIYADKCIKEQMLKIVAVMLFAKQNLKKTTAALTSFVQKHWAYIRSSLHRELHYINSDLTVSLFNMIYNSSFESSSGSPKRTLSRSFLVRHIRIYVLGRNTKTRIQ